MGKQSIEEYGDLSCCRPVNVTVCDTLSKKYSHIYFSENKENSTNKKHLLYNIISNIAKIYNQTLHTQYDWKVSTVALYFLAKKKFIYYFHQYLKLPTNT